MKEMKVYRLWKNWSYREEIPIWHEGKDFSLDWNMDPLLKQIQIADGKAQIEWKKREAGGGGRPCCTSAAKHVFQIYAINSMCLKKSSHKHCVCVEFFISIGHIHLVAAHFSAYHSAKIQCLVQNKANLHWHRDLTHWCIITV